MTRHYQVVEKIGEGGMGDLYKVYDRNLEVTRVMKVVRPLLRGLRGDAADRRFREEAKTAARLGDHPNFVSLHTFDVDPEGNAYLVMELVDGVDLRRGLEAFMTQRGHALPFEFCVEVGVQTLAALEYLHGQRLVHRDISPDNLMITLGPRGEPLLKVIDLGIAKSLDSDLGLTAMGAVGPRKAAYVSPEQLSDQPVDARTDLYSLAATLYQLATGHLPFAGESRRQVESQRLLAPPRSFDETDPEGRVPVRMRQAILRGLERRPDDRPQAARTFAAELERCAPERDAVALATATALLEDETAYTTWSRAETDDPVQRRLDRIFSANPEAAASAAEAPTLPLPSAANPPTVPNRLPTPGRTALSGRLRALAVAGAAVALAVVLGVVFWRGRAPEGPRATPIEEQSPPEDEATVDTQAGGQEAAAPAPEPGTDTEPGSTDVSSSSPARVWPAGSRAGQARLNPRDGLYYAWVPPGEFRSGCSPGDDRCEPDERPATRRVLAHGFWMGRSEVTVRAYKKSPKLASLLPPAPVFNPGWRDEAQPMVNVSFSEASRYCRWAASRLPTEVEWEYAARAGEKRSLPPDLAATAWWAENSDGRPRSVGQRGANRFGLYDTLGNAAEWVVPANGRPAGEGVLRGGSWLHGAEYLRYSFRLVESPARRDPMYGFRCVIDAGG